MMFRKIHVLFFALCMICFVPRSHAQRGKSEFGFGYGYYSLFSFIAKGQVYGSHYSASSGSFVWNYRYYLTKDVTLGLGIGYEDIASWGSVLTFAPEVTVKYLDTRNDRIRVRLYGAISYGMTIYNDHEVKPGNADNSGAKPWGVQATPIGVRVGRQFAYFAELGLGYKGLINTGLCVRFPRMLHRHSREQEPQQ